jgi:hypothetical protein
VVRLARPLLLAVVIAGFAQSAEAQDTTRPIVERDTTTSADSTRAATRRKPRAAARSADAVRPAGPRPVLGRHAGDRHAAYRDTAPLPGAILPQRRIVAFYGNPLSRRMGLLGEFPPEEMLRRLDQEVAEWRRLDPTTPVQPALHLVAVVAQVAPGRDGRYRARMDSALIERVYGWAKRRNALMFVDVQVGLSTLERELPALERFLKRPDVHLGIVPEFSMKDGRTPPGKKVGSYDAAAINYAAGVLAGLVTKYQLPPKILVVHRFTQPGVTNSKQIRLDPRVQIVMHMDGFGEPWLKRDSYYRYIKMEPVQFAGWKQFTKRKNDNPPTPREEILRLFPVPVYIQLQ